MSPVQQLKKNVIVGSLSLLSLLPITTHVNAQTLQNKSSACDWSSLRFHADYLPSVPSRGSKIVWGGNATDGEAVMNPPFSRQFLERVATAKVRRLETFAYLEGPCGDTGGKDDGERGRCRRMHNNFNAKNAPNTENSALKRWEPYTFQQMKLSGRYGIDYCEIDNLNNNVNVPMVPLLKKIKRMYDNQQIHCRLVLKNISAGEVYQIKSRVAPNPRDADFIAPFHIFEANNSKQKAAVDKAMLALKGHGAVAIFSFNTNAYGSNFTKDKFVTCPKTIRSGPTK